MTAAGVHLDDAVRGAASRYARRHHLDVLDLVPGDLGTEPVLDLARMVDPATYASNPLAPGHGPRQATLVHRAVLERAGIKAVGQLDPVTYFETIVELKKFAAKSTDLAIAVGLKAAPEGPSQRRAYLSARFSKAMPAVVAVPAVQFTVLGAGLWLAPGWGAAALASYVVQPYLAIGGTGLRPGDLTPLGALARPFRGAWRAIRTLMDRSGAEVPRPATPTTEEREAEYCQPPGRGHRPVLRTPTPDLPTVSRGVSFGAGPGRRPPAVQTGRVRA